jgi:hypothetical protein
MKEEVIIEKNVPMPVKTQRRAESQGPLKWEAIRALISLKEGMSILIKGRKVKQTNPNAMEWKEKVDKDLKEMKALVNSLIGFAEALQNWKQVDLKYFIPQPENKQQDEKTNTSSKVESLSKEGETNDNKETGSKKAKAAV